MKDNLISRQAALNAVTVWLNKARKVENHSNYNEGEIAAYETALSELKEIPSAQQWIPVQEKPKAQPIYMTDNGKIIPLPEPQALPLPEDWKAGAELCRMINANIDARIKHFLELERERKEGAKDDI